MDAMHQQSKFATDIRCQKCGQNGTAAWERETSETGRTRFILVRLCDNFYERVSKKAHSRVEIVCGACGHTILNDSTLAAERIARMF